MKKVLIASALLISPLASAKTLTVAVIDTGVDGTLPHLCKMGHRSFLTYGKNSKGKPISGDPLIDMHGHGTHVAGLINQNAGNTDYCIVSIQYYSDANSGRQNLKNMIAALRHAIDIKVDYINISGGGPEPQPDEKALIEEALKNGIKLVLAAGNGDDRSVGIDLSKNCTYFPACYDQRIVVVGNLKKALPTSYVPTENQRSPSSNYGTRVNRWEVGTDCTSNLPNGKTGQMSGTSQATAVATGKLIKEQLSKQ